MLLPLHVKRMRLGLTTLTKIYVIILTVSELNC